MQMVLLTAFGVGGATVVGALLGFAFKKITHTFTDIVLGFAAGVMLSAAVIGLILPSLEYGTAPYGLIVTVVGIFCGAAGLSVLDKIVPHLHNLAGIGSKAADGGTSEVDNASGQDHMAGTDATAADLSLQHTNEKQQINKVLLFVMAIGIHNLPEGIAAGVSFGTENVTDAFLVAGGIALQNIPEGMVIIAPMLAVGISPWRTFIIAAATGIVEVCGTLIGFFAVSLSTFILPFALAFAGGTMIYVVSDEMIPETHAHGHERGATYALLAGFCVMIAMDYLL